MTNDKNPKPRILMVLPTLGQRPELLIQTLRSIKTQAPIETDIAMVFPLNNKGTQKLAKDFGAIMVEDPGGLSASINAGISQAKPYHDYIGWLGDDDLMTENSLKVAVNALDSNPDAVLAFGYCDYIDDNNKHLFTSRAGRFAPWIMTWGPNLVPLPGMLYRKSALNVVGEFDEKNKFSMDLDMLLRLRKLGKFVNTKKKLAAFRWHPTSTTVANRKKGLIEARMVKRKYLPRPIQFIAPVWEFPVEIATKIATKHVNNLAKH